MYSKFMPKTTMITINMEISEILLCYNQYFQVRVQYYRVYLADKDYIF